MPVVWVNALLAVYGFVLCVNTPGCPLHLVPVRTVIEIGQLQLLVPAHLPSPGTDTAAPCRGMWRRAEDFKS